MLQCILFITTFHCLLSLQSEGSNRESYTLMRLNLGPTFLFKQTLPECFSNILIFKEICRRYTLHDGNRLKALARAKPTLIPAEALTGNRTPVGLSVGSVCLRTKPALCGPESGVLRSLRLRLLCCVSLSTAGSAVGPCGSAGRTVRRCLSAASNSISFTSDRRQKRQVDPPPASHPRFESDSWRERGKLEGGLVDVDWRAYRAIGITPSFPEWTREVRSGLSAVLYSRLLNSTERLHGLLRLIN